MDSKVTTADVNQNFGVFADKALVEPVIVTHGEQRVVIISGEDYDRLIEMRRAWRTVDAPADVVEAVHASQMDARHDHLNQLLADDRA